MTLNNNELWNNDESDYSEQQDQDKPKAYRVDDDDNLEEKDLKRTYLFGNSKVKSMNAPGMEGQGMGGEHFGQNNLTPSGDDKTNPTQNAGYGNAYFKRTQPSEEHLENPNSAAHGHQDKADNASGQINIPGPNELPDQQKASERKGEHTPNPDNDAQKSDQSKNTTTGASGRVEREHIET
jgi:hypothetical protein